MIRDLRFPIPTCPQGLTSKTFTPPPMGPYMNLPNIFDWHLQNSSQHPFYVFDNETADNDNNVSTITWGEAVKVVYRVANIVSTILDTQKEANSRPVVGLYYSLGTRGFPLRLAFTVTD